ncbi:hypothetical protein ATE84_3874 [Aquimarina sp. MAR_2010_214]|nr:hypothetical protein ATE84_3874 [Aquimarina sp. MAR_2010_214]
MMLRSMDDQSIKQLFICIEEYVVIEMLPKNSEKNLFILI